MVNENMIYITNVNKKDYLILQDICNSIKGFQQMGIEFPKSFLLLDSKTSMNMKGEISIVVKSNPNRDFKEITVEEMKAKLFSIYLSNSK